MPTQNTGRTKVRAIASIDIVVSQDVRTFFEEVSVNGHGGFQGLARALQEQLETSAVLHLTPDEFRRIVRYATDYGDGGYQQKFRKIVCSWVAQHADKLIV
jgi:hypothetical protein